MMSPTIRRGAIVALGAVIALLGLLITAGAASAHVTVDAPGATRGGSDQIITFRVPTESATAGTTELKVQLPTGTPIALVLVKPITGWRSRQTTVKLATAIVTADGDLTQAVSVIDWTADTAADAVPPGDFQEFTFIAGQLPDTTSLTFKAIQTYSDGSVVSWTDVEAPGSTANLVHPAPVLTLAAAERPPPSGSSPGPTLLSIIALGVAAAALSYAFLTRARQRSGAA